MRQVGSALYEVCRICGSPVKINKWLFGSLHLCLAQAEVAELQADTQRAAHWRAWVVSRQQEFNQ